uniref:Nucleoporin NUP42 n=1 Tax=Pavo cristatus TaxID=9049 RepID=A0A8C9FPU2_PAVCR
MTICQFFLQGRCRFGDRCWNEHPRGGGGRPHSGTGRRGIGAAAAVIQPPMFSNITAGGSSDGGGLPGASGFGPAAKNSVVLSQNAFSALSGAIPGHDCIAKDMATWESSGQWMFSCYSPMKDKPNVSGR